MPSGAGGRAELHPARHAHHRRRAACRRCCSNTSGFVYYVSITGITGAATALATDVGPEVARIKAKTDLPVVVGFGIKTPEAAAAIARVADGAVVGSAIVERIGAGASPAAIADFVRSLAEAAHRA